jgi:hypothetical protein
VCLHPSVSLNNEKICCEISEDKIAVCEKIAGLLCGKFSDLNSACSKVLVPVKIFQFQDMLNENRFLGIFRGHSKRPTVRSRCFELWWVTLLPNLGISARSIGLLAMAVLQHMTLGFLSKIHDGRCMYCISLFM